MVNWEKIKEWGFFFILSVQHVFAMMGSNILVPIVSDLPIQNSLFSAGLCTIFFHFICKRKVPVFLGSSFAFLNGLALFMKEFPDRHERLGHLFLGTLSTGIVYFIFSVIFYFVGTGVIRKLFPPVVIGPIIMTIGLTLAPAVIKSNIVDQYTSGNMSIAAAWTTAAVTTIVIVVVTLFGYKFMKTIPILIGLLVGYAVGACFGIANMKTLVDSPWILFEPDAFLDSFSFYKWITFDANAIVNFAPLAIVTLMEHFGDITTNGAIVGVNFFEDPGIHRTVFADGVALCTAALMGGPPITTYGENTGVLAITRQYNPKLLLAAGCIAVFLGVLVKFGAFLACTPAPVIGGAAIILFGMITSMGIKVMVDARAKLIHARNMIVVAFILVVGLGFSSANMTIGPVTISPLALATVLGIVANLILPHPKEENEEENQNAESESSESEKNEGENAGEKREDHEVL